MGGDLHEENKLFDGSQVNSIVTPIYKNREKECLNLASVSLTLRIDGFDDHDRDDQQGLCDVREV